MARITNAQILDISAPIEDAYEDMVDKLLINIGRHLTTNTASWTAFWEVQKLAEMGQLSRENAAIINQYVKDMPQELRDTMEETRRVALLGIEAQLQQAAKDGYIPEPIADTTLEVLQNYAQQAIDKLNLVNTTMLESSLSQYRKAIELTTEQAEKLVVQTEATQKFLNTAAGSVAEGAETRAQAMRWAIHKISQEGLTGFVDRAGRTWTPEAYVNMDIRTTVHNVAIQTTKNRMQDFGTQVFQVSSHVAARPLCYPYQGKFYSWDNTEGNIRLGNGRRVRYKALSSTSYGDAAGLFGINCGHYPILVIPGVSIPSGADSIEPPEINNKEYRLSQQQRALERKIRAAKREQAMMGAYAGQAEKDRIRTAQAAMRLFISQTGRTRRRDREQIVKE